MVMIFAARRGRRLDDAQRGRAARRLWTLRPALAAVLIGVVWTALRVDLGAPRQRASLPRQLARARSSQLLENPKVRAAASCGAVLTPNHRLIPDVRWVLDLPEDRVVARSDKASAEKVTTGLAILAASRQVFLRQGLDPDDDSEDDALRNLPPAGYERIAVHAVLFRLRPLRLGRGSRGA